MHRSAPIGRDYLPDRRGRDFLSRFSRSTDARPSSLYETHLMDPFTDLESDSISFVVGSSYNQQTTELTPVSEFTPPLTLPPILERFSADKKVWIKYTDMARVTVCQGKWWFLTTKNPSNPPTSPFVRILYACLQIRRTRQFLTRSPDSTSKATLKRSSHR
jgi:hypothetical protein